MIIPGISKRCKMFARPKSLLHVFETAPSESASIFRFRWFEPVEPEGTRFTSLGAFLFVLPATCGSRVIRLAFCISGRALAPQKADPLDGPQWADDGVEIMIVSSGIFAPKSPKILHPQKVLDPTALCGFLGFSSCQHQFFEKRAGGCYCCSNGWILKIGSWMLVIGIGRWLRSNLLHMVWEEMMIFKRHHPKSHLNSFFFHVFATRSLITDCDQSEWFWTNRLWPQSPLTRKTSKTTPKSIKSTLQ